MDKYQETYNTWNKVAQVYHEKFMDLEVYNHTYERFCAELSPTASILELGCGPGNVTRHLLAYSPEFNVLATDMAPKMIAMAKANVPQARFQVLDARDLHTMDAKFDALLLGFCMPYLSKEDCEKLLVDCGTILHENGLVYLSFIEGNYAHSGYQTGSTGDRSYVYYYEEALFIQRLRAHGFEIIHSFSVAYPLQASTQQHIAIIARKN